VARGQSTTGVDATAAPVPAKPAGASATPTANQILDRYEKAIGGRAAWQKYSSRVLMGTIEVASMNLSGTVLIQEKAPNKVHAAVIINGAAFQQGYDGITGWTDDPKNGLRDQTGAELAESKRDADFLQAFDLRKLYSRFAVTGTEKIGDHDAYVIEATVPEGGEPTKMYFDTQSGLLLRVVSENHDADGVSHLREDLDDYRDVDGVKLPFTSRQTNGDTTYTMTISEVHHNVELEDSDFAKPTAQ
jgi:zinc protease